MPKTRDESPLAAVDEDTAEEIIYRGGNVFSKYSPADSMTFKKLARIACYSGS